MFRSSSGICGFTRETLIAITINIDSWEHKCCSNANLGLSPEHPRVSTSDDVECFFSVLRDTLGKDFTLKHVQYEWRKACIEFTKRQDPHLPFFYYTSAHDRYYEKPRPSFNKPAKGKPKSKDNPRHKRIRQSELPGALVPGRATLAVSGSLSTRMKSHNIPISLPPPPNANTLSLLIDHSYTVVIIINNNIILSNIIIAVL